jgi:hypothetical protein
MNNWNFDCFTLSTGNSIKASAWVHQGKTTQRLDDRNWAWWTECSFTLLSSFSLTKYYQTSKNILALTA